MLKLKCFYEKETTYKVKYQGTLPDGTLVIVYLPTDSVEDDEERVPKSVTVTLE